jgi:hypothetical protein
MQLFFTPAAARKLRGIIHDQGAGVALRIQVRRGAWAMTLEPNSSEVLMINGDLRPESAKTGDARWRGLAAAAH